MSVKKIQSAALIWRDLQVPPKELHLDTLRCGQSFRWRHANGQWSCVLYGKLYVLKQTDSTVLYGLTDETMATEMRTVLRDYFQLDRVRLEECYKRWSSADPNFKRRSQFLEGIRILRQDPWENLISFICSSNNNIARISQMVQNLCIHFGSPVAELDGVVHHDFPSVAALAQDNVEERLRQLGFGYRAKYVAQTAYQIRHAKPDGWLTSLRTVPYPEAKQELLSLVGVGPKVADCVCLMSLDHPEAIPVDTHVWQIALRDYGFGKKQSSAKTTKTMTNKMYKEIADYFREIFGEYAGWAHSVLFTADLRAFESRSAHGISATKETNETIATLKVEATMTLRRSKRVRTAAA